MKSQVLVASKYVEENNEVPVIMAPNYIKTNFQYTSPCSQTVIVVLSVNADLYNVFFHSSSIEKMKFQC